MDNPKADSRLTMGSLFSGIGGIELAAERAGFETVFQIEIDDYASKVLERHWPYVTRWRDIYDVRADDILRATGLEKGQLTVLSGGFPCQPHSVAGLRKAADDERDLWPEYRRLIRDLEPRWVVGENVRGLLSSDNGRFFGNVLRDLAALGYNAGWCMYRAADVGAVHPRARVFTFAHADSDSVFDVGYCKTIGGREEGEKERCKDWLTIELSCGGVAPSEWREPGGVYRSLLCRENDGVPYWVDRLKCLGNAVVPQQAYPLFRAIAEIELNLITEADLPSVSKQGLFHLET